jgi:hypothetical protein
MADVVLCNIEMFPPPIIMCLKNATFWTSDGSRYELDTACDMWMNRHNRVSCAGASRAGCNVGPENRYLWVPQILPYPYNNPTRCTNFKKLFWNEILHVSYNSSVHRQEFFTVHTAIQVYRQLSSRIRMVTAVPSWSCSQAVCIMINSYNKTN